MFEEAISALAYAEESLRLAAEKLYDLESDETYGDLAHKLGNDALTRSDWCHKTAKKLEDV